MSTAISNDIKGKIIAVCTSTVKGTKKRMFSRVFSWKITDFSGMGMQKTNPIDS
ncbi:MAG: hypothetical protein NKF70_14310 [Methanobacterium sp. ERen5]|nr:MAG: hypothetical protein NKF70_14310 [Methanobacterium sp. ERen5]